MFVVWLLTRVIPIVSISGRWTLRSTPRRMRARAGQLLYNFNKPKLFVDHIIIVDPRDSRTLYVATHRHKEPGGLFKSTDGGRKWRESSELKNEALHSLTQADADPNVLIAGTFNGIFRSDNSGRFMDATADVQNAGPGSRPSRSRLIPRTVNTIYARHLVPALQIHRWRAELEEHQERNY